MCDLIEQQELKINFLKGVELRKVHPVRTLYRLTLPGKLFDKYCQKNLVSVRFGQTDSGDVICLLNLSDAEKHRREIENKHMEAKK